MCSPLACGVEAKQGPGEVVGAGALKLTCVPQLYAWGRRLEHSEVAQLCEAAGQAVDPSKPYAELWMGTHPAAPSTLGDSGTQLLALLRDHPQLLGAALQAFGADLPFLFKVLSVDTALSIQSHPDKRLAERLHAERPQDYKDDNHKPEMALALTEFEALCSFVAHDELVAAFQQVPELQEACSAALADAYCSSSSPPAERRAALRAAFSALITAEPGAAAAAAERMCARLGAEESAGRSLSERERLVLRLQAQYPGDVGVLASWFLNYVRLAPGEAIYLPANEPHAYVSGEIVECMATSDNVIRAGLTPKLRDTEVLCSSLTYSQGPPEVLRGEQRILPHLALYRPGAREFEMWRFTPGAGASDQLPPSSGPLILLVQHGSGRLAAGAERGSGGGRAVQRGDVFFVPAGVPLDVDASTDMTVWVAAVNGMAFDSE